jgi:hypothetical protein
VEWNLRRRRSLLLRLPLLRLCLLRLCLLRFLRARLRPGSGGVRVS